MRNSINNSVITKIIVSDHQGFGTSCNGSLHGLSADKQSDPQLLFSTACPDCTNATLHQGVEVWFKLISTDQRCQISQTMLCQSWMYYFLYNNTLSCTTDNLNYSTANSALHSCNILESVLYIYRCLVYINVDHQQQQGVNRKAAVSQSAPTHHVKQIERHAQVHLLDVQPLDGQSPALSTYQMGRLTLISCSYSLIPCHMPQLIIL